MIVAELEASMCFRMPSVVAEVTESVFRKFKKSGLGHWVIWTGNEINKNTLPVKAGLNMFLPKPPKASLATPMAMKVPIIIIQFGMELGRLKASKIPVITADKSVVVFFDLRR